MEIRRMTQLTLCPHILHILQIYCRWCEDMTTTSMVASYVQFVDSTSHRRMNSAWAQENNFHLTFQSGGWKQVLCFLKNLSTIAPRQLKWHAFDHHMRDAEETMGIKNLYCGRYKFSNDMVQYYSPSTLNFSHNAVEKVIEPRVDQRLSRSCWLKWVQKINCTQIRALRQDTSYLVNRGLLLVLKGLDRKIQHGILKQENATNMYERLSKCCITSSGTCPRSRKLLSCKDCLVIETISNM